MKEYCLVKATPWGMAIYRKSIYCNTYRLLKSVYGSSSWSMYLNVNELKQGSFDYYETDNLEELYDTASMIALEC